MCHHKKEHADHWSYFKKVVYPYEHFFTGEQNEKPLSNITLEDFHSKISQCFPADGEIERRNDFHKVFVLINGKELTELHNKSHVILLADSFAEFVKVSY